MTMARIHHNASGRLVLYADRDDVALAACDVRFVVVGLHNVASVKVRFQIPGVVDVGDGRGVNRVFDAGRRCDEGTDLEIPVPLLVVAAS